MKVLIIEGPRKGAIHQGSDMTFEMYDPRRPLPEARYVPGPNIPSEPLPGPTRTTYRVMPFKIEGVTRYFGVLAFKGGGNPMLAWVDGKVRDAELSDL